MSEIPFNDGLESFSPSAAPNDAAEGSGYPPQDQQKQLLAVATAEHEVRQADEAEAAALLDSLDADGETPQQRTTRLTAFIDQYCADLRIPKDRMEAVVLECQAYEDDGRAMFDPSLQISEEDAPFIRDKILNLVPPIEEQRAQIRRNDETTANNAELTAKSAEENEDKATTTDNADVKSNENTEYQHLNTIKTNNYG